MITEEQKSKIIELRGKGYSFDKICKELSISKQTAINHAKALSAEIANHRALKNEQLLEEAQLTKIYRIEYLCEQLKTIKKEIKYRGYMDLSTDKLIAIWGRMSDQLSKELEGSSPEDLEINNSKPLSQN